MAAVADFAVASAAMDIPTSLVLTSDDPGSRGLSDACDLLTARGEAARPNLRLCKGSPSVDEARELRSPSFRSCSTPSNPSSRPLSARGMVLMAISAGFVDQEQLARVLIAIGQEGLSVRGLVVTNPMRGDRTLGSLPNARRASDPVPSASRPGALEWRCRRPVTTMREGPAFPDLGGGITTDAEGIVVRPIPPQRPRPLSFSSVGWSVFASCWAPFAVAARSG